MRRKNSLMKLMKISFHYSLRIFAIFATKFQETTAANVAARKEALNDFVVAWRHQNTPNPEQSLAGRPFKSFTKIHKIIPERLGT